MISTKARTRRSLGTRMKQVLLASFRSGNSRHDLQDHEKEESAGQPDLALNADISSRFLRLDPGSVERLGRYETALWRQVYQVIFVLDYLRRQNLDLKWLPRPSSSVGRFRPLRSIFPKD